MYLRILTLTPESNRPRLDTIDNLRPFLLEKFAGFLALNKDKAATFTHRYPVVQCKIVRDRILIIGINEGADFLLGFFGDRAEISSGGITCTMTGPAPVIRTEEFGIATRSFTYEFVTPWLALNQQNAKKFYELKGKSERDAFVNAILARNLTTFAKALGYQLPGPIVCDHKLRFRKDRINGSNEIVFEGKFRTSLRIPDNLAIGLSVSQGFGTIWSVGDSGSEMHGERP